MRNKKIFQRHAQNRVGEFDISTLKNNDGNDFVSWQFNGETTLRHVTLENEKNATYVVAMLQEICNTLEAVGPATKQLLAGIPEPIEVKSKTALLFSSRENITETLKFVKYQEAWFSKLKIETSNVANRLRGTKPTDYYNLRLAILSELAKELKDFSYNIRRDEGYVPKITIILKHQIPTKLLGKDIIAQKTQNFTIDHALARLTAYYHNEKIPKDKLDAKGIEKTLANITKTIEKEPGHELLTSEDITEIIQTDLKELGAVTLAKIRHRKSEQAKATIEENKEISDYLTCWPKRKKIAVTIYAGPTNSGKTYQAMQHLKRSQNGMYLAPLRLLALEKYQELNAENIPCSLITGEEQIAVTPNLSCRTIEMVDNTTEWKTVIIDELQMIGDTQRGWAWTNAYCGANCKELVITCPEYAIPAVGKLASIFEDTVTVIRCTRRSALQIGGKIRKLKDLPPATALIAFSRRAVLELKALLDQLGRRPAVLYGNLAPEIRQAEAKRFRNGETDIVIATDAIGMGLNLPVKHIVLWEARKFDGIEFRELNSTEIQQIGGRAGRNLETGQVHGMAPNGQHRIQMLLHQKVSWELKTIPAGFTAYHLKEIRKVLETDCYHTALTFFEHQMPMNKPFKARVPDSCYLIANNLKLNKLNEEQATMWLTAPVTEDELALAWLQDWYWSYTQGTVATLPSPPEGSIEDLENYIKVTDMYLWFSRKFPETFPNSEQVRSYRKNTISEIEQELRSKWKAHGLRDCECNRCGTKLLPSSRFNNCRDCFEKEKEERY